MTCGILIDNELLVTSHYCQCFLYLIGSETRWSLSPPPPLVDNGVSYFSRVPPVPVSCCLSAATELLLWRSHPAGTFPGCLVYWQQRFIVVSLRVKHQIVFYLNITLVLTCCMCVEQQAHSGFHAALTLCACPRRSNYSGPKRSKPRLVCSREKQWTCFPTPHPFGWFLFLWLLC